MVDGEGIQPLWILIERWQAGLIELPPLSSGNGSGDCVAGHLPEPPAWVAFAAGCDGHQG
jgi:hypothetical protein